jgi:hypothetical protein
VGVATLEAKVAGVFSGLLHSVSPTSALRELEAEVWPCRVSRIQRRDCRKEGVDNGRCPVCLRRDCGRRVRAARLALRNRNGIAGESGVTALPADVGSGADISPRQSGDIAHGTATGFRRIAA